MIEQAIREELAATNGKRSQMRIRGYIANGVNARDGGVKALIGFDKAFFIELHTNSFQSQSCQQRLSTDGP